MPKRANYKQWLTGDTEIPKSAPLVHRVRFNRLRNRVARLAAHNGRKLHVNSGYRTYAEQAKLWHDYLHGGNLAARPGTSNHEKGLAMDVSDRGQPVGSSAKNRTAMKHLRLCLPVPGEKWHMEIGNTWRA